MYVQLWKVSGVSQLRQAVKSAISHFIRFKGLFPAGAAVISGNGPYKSATLLNQGDTSHKSLGNKPTEQGEGR